MKNKHLPEKNFPFLKFDAIVNFKLGIFYKIKYNLFTFGIASFHMSVIQFVYFVKLTCLTPRTYNKYIDDTRRGGGY